MQVKALEGLFIAWGKHLASHPSRALKSPPDFYSQDLEPEFARVGLDAALFDSSKFPALDDLAIDLRPTPQLILEDFLPATWVPNQVKHEVAGNPLAQLLLAYIWKLGKFPEVSNVVAGYRSPDTQDTVDVDENAVVMRQFGRHLASPTSEPIFDQHTARFWKIYSNLVPTPASPSPGFLELLSENVDQPCTSDDRRKYVAWWRSTSLAQMPVINQMWADRIMFSLGKAAKRIGKKLLKPGEDNNATKGGRGKKVTTSAAAEELVARNPGLGIGQMRPLLMERLNISAAHANTCFYNAKRKLG